MNAATASVAVTDVLTAASTSVSGMPNTTTFTWLIQKHGIGNALIGLLRRSRQAPDRLEGVSTKGEVMGTETEAPQMRFNWWGRSENRAEDGWWYHGFLWAYGCYHRTRFGAWLHAKLQG